MTAWPLPGDEAATTNPAWRDIARPEQLPPPGDWLIWYIQAGRGWGKTRTGAEATWEASKRNARIAIVAESFSEGRDVCIEGETGIKTLHPDLHFNRSIGEMTFPSGARGKIYSAEDPDSLRGPNNYFAWGDEPAKWRYLKQTLDQLWFTLRKGDVRAVLTTTPRRIPLLMELKARSTTHVTRGTTYDNLANLAPAYISNIVKPYEGTELGRQELNAEDLEDAKDALWARAQIESMRVTRAPDLTTIVVGVDPNNTGTGDDAGIVTGGIGPCNCNGEWETHGFMLSDDTTSGGPRVWARDSVTAYHKFKADQLVAEDNNGGEMVAITISTIDGAPPVKRIHASRGKHTRAQPIALLCNKIHHVGTFPLLEDELCTWVPGMDSPNRLDAYVWTFTALMIGLSQGVFL